MFLQIGDVWRNAHRTVTGSSSPSAPAHGWHRRRTPRPATATPAVRGRRYSRTKAAGACSCCGLAGNRRLHCSRHQGVSQPEAGGIWMQHSSTRSAATRPANRHFVIELELRRLSAIGRSSQAVRWSRASLAAPFVVGRLVVWTRHRPIVVRLLGRFEVLASEP